MHPLRTRIRFFFKEAGRHTHSFGMDRTANLAARREQEEERARGGRGGAALEEEDPSPFSPPATVKHTNCYH